MKMQCAECGNMVRVGKVAGWRAGRANSRCYACGGLRLEPYVKLKSKLDQLCDRAVADGMVNGTLCLTPQDAAALLGINQNRN